MKKLTLITILLPIFIMSCKSTKTPPDTDSIEFAVFSAYPLDDIEDSEPVYIDLDELKSYKVGDTIEVNNKGVIPSKNSPQNDWHNVVLDYRLPVNQKFSRDEAESNQ